MKKNYLMRVMLMLSLFITSIAWAQEKTVSGKITSREDGSSIPGVNVVVKGTTNGTTTDADGFYKLTVPASGGGVLVFSFIGLKSEEIIIGERSTIDIGMNLDVTELNEVVVVGYGSQDKRTLTSAISSVKGSDLALLPVQSFDQALIGKAAGMQVSLTSGMVGTAPRIRIRGTNSITSGVSPLYVVDGVPAASGNQSGVASGNALGDINPSDIESIEVLKDGAATAIYGSRAANGVVLITTKTGKSGKAKINYDFQMGVNTVAKRFDLLNADEFIAISNEKFATTNTLPQAFAGPDNVNTDWQKVIFQNGITQNHNLNFSGGSDDISYFMSAGYLKEEGAIVRNSLEKYTMRANLDYHGVKWLSTGLKLGLTRQVNNNLNSGAAALSGNVTSALKAFPNVPVYDANNPTGYNITADNAGLGRGNNLLDIASKYTNPQYTLDKNIYEADNYRIIANGYLQANIMEGLNLRTQFGTDVVDNNDFQSLDPIHGDGGGSTKGYVYRGVNRTLVWNWQNTLNFKRTIAENHNLGITVGNEYQKSIYRSFYGDGTTFSDPLFVKYDLISNTYLTQGSGGDYSTNGFDSYFGRINYDFKQKYLLGFSVRRDAISSIPLANRKGTFFGGSAGWVISEENFFNIESISQLKVRGSYAEVGNTAIGDFDYISTYSAALYGGQTGIVFSNAGNGGLQWETSKKLDVGLDIGFFNQRVTASVEYYKNDVDNLILAAFTSPTAGIPGNSIKKNVGALQNSGFELTIGTDNLKRGPLNWTTDLTFTTNKNEVTKLNAEQIGTYTITRVGESINSIYTFESAGVNKANGNPLYVRGDGSIIQGNPDNNTYYLYDANNPGDVSQSTTALSNGDLKVLGTTNPKWFGGLNNTLRYKGVDFQLMLTYAGGNKVYNATRQGNLQMEFTNNSREILNRWTPENPDTDVPRLKYANSSFVNLNSSRFVEKGDYLRVQNVSLGYTIPKTALNSFAKGTISNVRIYAQVRNALIFTKYKGSDPELGAGVDNNTNPLLRTYNFGLSIGL